MDARSTLLKLAIARRADGTRQEDVAALLGMSAGALSMKLNGKSELSLDEAHRIAQYLGTTLEVVHFLAR